jgi:neutral ceramidase
MTLRAGTASLTITPPVGVELAGYSFGPSLGVLGDLQAQVLVLEDGEKTVAIVTADLLAFGTAFAAGVRQRVQEQLGIPGEHVLLSASHTHSGPTTMSFRQWGALDEEYVRWLATSLVGVIASAYKNRKEIHLGQGVGRVETISENRRGIPQLRDTAVPVLSLEDIEGNIECVFFNFSCHPVSLHSYRSLVSPDYPGYARQVVRSVLGEAVTAMFSLGSAGDINPAGYVPNQTTPRRSRQIGSILGCEVAKTALEARASHEPVLQVARKVIDLPAAPLPGVRELQAMVNEFSRQAESLRAQGGSWEQIARWEIQRDWAFDGLDAWENNRVLEAVPVELMAVRLGDAVLIAAPLEIFTETGLAIKADSPAGMTVVCSNSNGAAGYLPTADTYQVEDYTNPQGLAPKVYGLYAFAEAAETEFHRQAVQLIQSLFS